MAKSVSITNSSTGSVKLEPGDVIATGTPSGAGYARTPPVFMRPGDVCETEIESTGQLSNTNAPLATFDYADIGAIPHYDQDLVGECFLQAA
ncbi:MAG: fumarylacetoacetate hydrolase family protein [Novosphingobium sp.]